MNWSEQDLNKHLLQTAWDGISWTPERRGPAFAAGYDDEINSMRETLVKLAEEARRPEADVDEALASWRKMYAARCNAFLGAQSRIVSAWIAGPSNFPTRTMEKRNDTANKRLDELVGARAAFLKRLRRQWDIRTNGEIRVNDDDAVEQIKKKIEGIETLRDKCKAYNALIRKHAKAGPEKQVAALIEAGLSENKARELLKPDFMGRVGFPPYLFQNWNGEITRLKARLVQIEHRSKVEDRTLDLPNGITIERVMADNRIRIYFPGKPSPEMIARLKGHGFKWAPTLGAWSNFVNWRSESLCDQLEKEATPTA